MKKTTLISLTMITSAALMIFSCRDNKKGTAITTYEIIDSSWSYGPGEINSLQTDPVYMGITKTKNTISRRNKPFSKGDTIKIIKEYLGN